jgi:tetratricopeptide (TPR) repeat protein
MNPTELWKAFSRHEQMLASGDYRSSRPFFETFLQQFPDHAPAANNLGVCFYQEFWATQSQDCLRKAEEMFRKSLELDPEFADALSNLGNLYDDLQKLPEAEGFLRKAVELAPDHTDACSNLGMVLHRQNKLAEAIDYYKQAIKADPAHANAWCNLGEALRELGRLTEALQATERALEINPHHPQAGPNRARLQQLLAKQG